MLGIVFPLACMYQDQPNLYRKIHVIGHKTAAAIRGRVVGTVTGRTDRIRSRTAIRLLQYTVAGNDPVEIKYSPSVKESHAARVAFHLDFIACPHLSFGSRFSRSPAI